MSYSTILAQIKTSVEAVTNVGKVYSNIRYAQDLGNFYEIFRTTINNQDEIRVWMISRNGRQSITGPKEVSFGNFRFVIPATQRAIVHNILIEGLMSFKDDDTEVDFQALLDSVHDQIKNNLTFSNTAKTRSDPMSTIDYRYLGPVLCHYATVEFGVLEIDGINPV